MNSRALRAIVHKDLKTVVRSKAVFLPLIFVPLVLLLVLPVILVVAAVVASDSSSATTLQLRPLLENLPSTIQATLASYNEPQKWVYLMLVYFMAPMFLILPIVVSVVIAADSFAGEKERKTLEALFYSPTTDRELFLAKLLAAWLPALSLSLVGLVVYSLVVNLAAWPIMHHLFFPTTMWVVLAVWVAPAIAAMGLGATVLVSARVRGFQEAYQIGSVIVLPVVFLVIGQIRGIFAFNVGFVLLLGLAFWALDAFLLWLGFRMFSRPKLTPQL